MPSPARPRRLRTAYAILMGATVVLATLWWARPLLVQALRTAGWLRSAPSPMPDIIPPAFRGRWVEDGDECGDADAEARVGGSSVNYDRLSFLADHVARASTDELVLSGQSFADGDPQPGTVNLQLSETRHLRIVADGLDPRETFTRCAEQP